MIVYLIRHGQTGHNRDGLGLGRADVPLTELGERQAEAAGAHLARDPIERVFSSPLVRAQKTAAAIAAPHGLEVEPAGALIEMDVGDTEGLPFATIRERYHDFLTLWASDGCASAVMPGGESLDHVAGRLDPFIAELRDLSGASVAIVSHNFVIKVLFCRLLGLSLDHFREITVDLASLTTITLNGERVNVRSLNDCCHLRLLEP